MKKTFVLSMLSLLISIAGFSQTARLQVIHNSPTPTVDVYANDGLLLNDFAFRTATPFIDVPAGIELNLGIALANSASASDAIANFPVTLEENKTYVVIANGIVGGDPGFGLNIFDMGMETSDAPGNVGILFFHGSPDAPTVDVLAGGSVLIDDASYGDFAGYLNVPAASYDLAITPGSDNSTIVATYNADLSFWGGNTAVIFASGFLGGDVPAFEPWVALSNGGTFPLVAEVPEAETARLQVIHNSPTPTVDVYANGDLLLDNFAFRTATPFIDVPAGVELNLGVALGNSTSATDALVNFPVTLEAGKTYVVVANGIVGGDPGFGLNIFDMGMETSDGDGNVGILFFHGSPDAPTVDVLAGGSVLIDDASYGDFAGYLNVPASTYELSITPGSDNNTVVASYMADLSFWAGRTAVIFASGFLSGDDPAFEPWVALSNGGTFPLPAVEGFGDAVEQSLVSNISNNPTDLNSLVNVYPNPVTGQQMNVVLDFETATNLSYQLIDASGKQIQSRNFGKVDQGFQQYEIGLTDIPVGLYFARFQTDNGIITMKVSLVR